MQTTEDKIQKKKKKKTMKKKKMKKTQKENKRKTFEETCQTYGCQKEKPSNMQSNTEIVKMWNDKKNIEDRCAIKQKRPIETIIEKKINDARKLTHTLTTCNNHNDDVQQRRDASPHANLARNHR